MSASSGRLDAIMAYYQENNSQITKDRNAIDKEKSKKRSLYRKVYYQENRDYFIGHSKRYYKVNKEHCNSLKKLADHRRRTNLNNCSPTDEKYLKQFNGSKQTCPITGSNIVELEHVYPVSKGWLGNNLGNLMWLQSSVNCSKGNKNVFTWLSELTQKDLDYLLREEPAVPTLEQFRDNYKAELTKQAELLGMTYHEYKTEYNKKYTEATEQQ